MWMSSSRGFEKSINFWLMDDVLKKAAQIMPVWAMNDANVNTDMSSPLTLKNQA